MVASTCLRLSAVSSHAVIFLNVTAVLLEANETFSHQAYVVAEPVMHRISNPEVRGSISGRGDAVQRLWAKDFFGDDAAFYQITSNSCYF